MPNILRAVSDRAADSNPPIRFVMQRAPRPSLRLTLWLYESRCNWAVRRCGSVSIFWQDACLSDEPFRQTLAGLDLLLMPYKPSPCAQLRSGMIVNAALAGVPALHTKGLGIKKLLQLTRAAAETPHEFANHIARLSTLDAVDQDQPAAAREFLIEQFKRTRKLLVSLVDDPTAQAAKLGERFGGMANTLRFVRRRWLRAGSHAVCR